MSQLPPDVFVPVPIRWRHVQPDDIVVSAAGDLRAVADNRNGQITLHGWPRPFTRDPDATATVLIPASERDALTLTRDQLGAQVESRRLNQEQGAA